MAKTKVRTPNGVVTVEHPDGATQEQILNFAKAQYGRIKEIPEPILNPGDTPVRGPVNSFFSGVGSGMADVGLGLRQFTADLAGSLPESPMLAGASAQSPLLREELREKRKIDAPLDATGSGTVGKITGNIAAIAPTLAIPGANSLTGASLTGLGLGAIQPAESGGERLANTAFGAGGGFIGQKVGTSASNKIAQLLGDRATNRAALQTARQPLDDLVKRSSDAGFVIPPSTVNPSTFNRMAEGLVGKISTAQGSSVLNQGVFNRIARESVGLPEGVPLSKASLQGIRSKLGKIYEGIKKSDDIIVDDVFRSDIAGIADVAGNVQSAFPNLPVSGAETVGKLVDGLNVDRFTARAGVDLVKSLRRESKTLFKSFDDPTKYAEAVAKRRAADAVDDMILRNLENTGRLDLASQYKPAREMIAKTHTIEAALNEAGTIDPKILARQLNSGTPMTGDMELAARFADSFRSASRATNESFPLFSPLDFYTSLGLGGMVDPTLAAAGVARPLLRRGLLTGPAQRSLLSPSTLPAEAADQGLSVLEMLSRRGGALGAIGSVNATQ